MASAVRISTLFAIFLLIASASGASLNKRQAEEDDIINDGLNGDDIEDTVEETWDDDEDADEKETFVDDGTDTFVDDSTDTFVDDGTDTFVDDRTDTFVDDGTDTFVDDDTDTFADDGTDGEETVNDEGNVDETWNEEGPNEEETMDDEDNVEETWEDDVNDEETLDEEENEDESWDQADIDGQEMWDDLDASEVESLEKELGLLTEEDDTDDSQDFLRSPYETKVGNNDVQNKSPFDEYLFKKNERDQGRKASTDFWSDFKTRDKQWGPDSSETW